MITLLIDNQRVNLSADISTDYYDKNPFFTKEGQHTFDIDINLNDPINAIIYKSMHRLDMTKRPINRSALLYDEHGVLINGTEIILEIDNNNAKIQLVSGNSDLNYLSGGDKKIKEFDLGTISELTTDIAIDTLKKGYPTYDFVCTPICTSPKYLYTDYPILKSGSIIMNEINEPSTIDNLSYVNGTTLCPQPYMISIVKKIINALGYTIKNNVLEKYSRYNKLILINGYASLSYNEMIPNWSINDFITEIEKLCNVAFIVDQNYKTVDIININDYYTTSKYLYIEEVIGDINKKYDQDSNLNIIYDNVSYKLPTYDEYKYASIDKKIIKSCSIINCPSQTWSYNYEPKCLFDIWYQIYGDKSFTNDTEANDKITSVYNLMNLYKTPLFNDYNFAIRRISAGVRELFILQLVNQFVGHVNEDSDNSVELKIIPCEMVWLKPSVTGSSYCTYPMPIARNCNTTDIDNETKDTNGLNQLITNGIEDETVSDVFYAAYYFGIKTQEWMNISTSFVAPVSMPSNDIMRYIQSDGNNNSPFAQALQFLSCDDTDCNMSILGINGLYNKLYNKNIVIDTQTQYIIKIKSIRKLDSRSIFIIKNKKFYCKELKYNIQNGKMSEIVEGTFYLMN